MISLPPFVRHSLAAFFVLMVPLGVFLRHHSYGFFYPETLVIIGLTLVGGLLLGAIMTWGRTPGMVVAATFMGVLVVDIQTEWITTVGLRLLLIILAWGAFFWWLRRRIPGVLTWLALPMIVGTLFSPGAPANLRLGEPGVRPGDDPDLPFILHIVLDEQVGVAGIPAEFDPDGFYASLLKEAYVDRGFTVYGRAYSRYPSTRMSLSNMLNGVASDDIDAWFRGGFTRGDLLESNPWFDQLREAGYRFHVVQSDYLRFLDPRPGNLREGDSLVGFGTHDLAAFAAAPLSVSQKIPFVLGTYFRLSFILGKLAAGFDRLRVAAPWVPLPDWYLGGTRIGPLASMNQLDRLLADLDQAGPGQMWFAHILSPHFPYGWHGDCSLEPDVSRWLEAKDYQAEPDRNTEESRAQRYALYLEQMRCVQDKLAAAFDGLEKRGLWENTVVIVHGDHGSRISLHEPIPANAQVMTPQDFGDYYAAFYAVKIPGRPATYDDRLLPLDHLFGHEFLEGTAPGEPSLEAAPEVFLTFKDEVMMSVPLTSLGQERPQ